MLFCSPHPSQTFKLWLKNSWMQPLGSNLLKCTEMNRNYGAGIIAVDCAFEQQREGRWEIKVCINEKAAKSFFLFFFLSSIPSFRKDKLVHPAFWFVPSQNWQRSASCKEGASAQRYSAKLHRQSPTSCSCLPQRNFPVKEAERSDPVFLEHHLWQSLPLSRGLRGNVQYILLFFWNKASVVQATWIVAMKNSHTPPRAKSLKNNRAMSSFLSITFFARDYTGTLPSRRDTFQNRITAANAEIKLIKLQKILLCSLS